MSRLTPRLRWHAPAARVRALQGQLEVMLADARRDRAAATDLREIVALTSVIHQGEEWVAMCREHLAAVRLRTGWRRPARAASPRRDDACAPTRAAAVSQPPPAARVGAGPGVAGAAPPSGMGHGWPALASGAGSAAALSGRSDGTPPASPLTARHPDNPSFCSENEGISPNVCECEDIHYAQLRDWICRSPC